MQPVRPNVCAGRVGGRAALAVERQYAFVTIGFRLPIIETMWFLSETLSRRILSNPLPPTHAEDWLSPRHRYGCEVDIRELSERTTALGTMV